MLELYDAIVAPTSNSFVLSESVILFLALEVKLTIKNTAPAADTVRNLMNKKMRIRVITIMIYNLYFIGLSGKMVNFANIQY